MAFSGHGVFLCLKLHVIINLTFKQRNLFMDSKLQKIAAFAKNKLAHDKTGHNFDHIERVVKMAQKLTKQQPGNVDLAVILAAAYLHDTIDDKLVANQQVALTQVINLLENLQFTPDQIKNITNTITKMSYSSSLNGKQELSIEGQIVQDADWLDALGAIGIMRAIYYGGAHGEKIYDPEIVPRNKMTKQDYRNLDDETIINHFYEKLFKLTSMLNTQQARQIAAKRQQFMEDFITNFKNEWNALS